MGLTITGGVTFTGGLTFSPPGISNDPYWNYVTTLLSSTATTPPANNNTFIDSSVNNYTIVKNGNAAQGSFTPFGSNWSNYLDGTGDYLVMPSSAVFAFGTGDYTIEGWFYKTNSIFAQILGFTNDRDNLDWNANGTLNFFDGSATTTVAAAPSNQWVHLAYTRSSGTVRIFINGVLVTTVASSFNSSTNRGMVIGARAPSVQGSNPFPGYVSNVRVVKGTAVYTADFTPSTAPLTAIAGTSLLTCQSNRIVDNSGNNLTITRAGDTSVSPFSPFMSGQTYNPSTNGGSTYFDGSGDYLSATTTSALTMAGDFTIEFWVYFSSLDTAERIPVNGWNTGQGWLISTQSNAWNWKSNGAFTLSYSAVAPVAGQWYHVAVSRSGSATNNIKMFINGTQVAQGTTTNTITPAASSVGIVVGGGQGGGGQLITGYVSNFRIVVGTALYTASFTPPTQPLSVITNTALLMTMAYSGIEDFSSDANYETAGNTQLSTAITKYGSTSIAFDGTDDYLLAPSSAAFNFDAGDFTIETWVYFSALSSNRMILDRWITGNTGGWQLYWRATGTSLAFFVGSAVVVQDPSTTNIVANTWYHVAVTRSSGTVRLFIDGISVASASNTASLNSTLPLAVGIQYSTLTNDFQGNISDLRITKGIARYTTNFTPPAAALPTF